MPASSVSVSKTAINALVILFINHSSSFENVPENAGFDFIIAQKYHVNSDKTEIYEFLYKK